MSVNYIHDLLESSSSCANISTWVHGFWSLELSLESFLALDMSAFEFHAKKTPQNF